MKEQYWGEGKEIEYKREIPERRVKFLKDVIAFANSSGGVIVLGVDEKSHDVVGLGDKNPFKLSDDITNMIADNCVPQIETLISVKTIESEVVLEIEVFPGRLRPYYLHNKAKEESVYIRINGTSRVASPAKIKELELEGAKISYDSLQEIGAEYDENRALRLCSDMKEVALRRCKSEEEKLSVKDMTISKLEDLGVLCRLGKSLFPTHAFMLMTDNKNLMAKIQCAVFKGTERTIFVDKREYTGPVFEQLEDAYQFVLRNIKLGGVVNGLYTEDVYEMPLSVIREAIANAVVHRSYLEKSCVQVSLYDDRLEVVSPGSLYGGLSIEDIKQGRSQCRNTAIAESFSYMRLIDSWGTGIPRIISECKEYGLKDPLWEEFADGIRLTIYRNNAIADKLPINGKIADKLPINGEIADKKDQKYNLIKQFIADNGRITSAETMGLLGVKQRQARNILNELVDAGVLSKNGQNKGTYYTLT